MSSVGKAIGKVVGGITGSTAAAEGAQDAAATQASAAQAGVDEQKRQFDKIVELFSPFVKAGTGSLAQQQAILGLSGGAAQQKVISELEASPYFQALANQGENAILQNASATGNLRGGNVQQALAQYRPNVLNQLLQQRFQNLGGITQLGQASAGNQASAGMNASSNIANLLQQQGAALAGGQLAKAGQQKSAFGDLLGIGGAIAAF